MTEKEYNDMLSKVKKGLSNHNLPHMSRDLSLKGEEMTPQYLHRIRKGQIKRPPEGKLVAINNHMFG